MLEKLLRPSSSRYREEAPAGSRPAAELFPELAYSPRDRLFFLEDGHLAFSYLCAPRTGVSESDAESLQGLLNQDWPAGGMMQIVHWASPDIEPHLQAALSLRDEATGVLREVIERRADFLRGGLHEALGDPSASKLRNHYIIVTGKVPCDAEPSDQEIDNVVRLRRSVGQALASIDMHPIPMDAGMHIRLMGSILNWQDGARWKESTPSQLYDRNEWIRDQLVDIGNRITADKEGLRLGDPEKPDAHVRMLSPKQYPERVVMGLAGLFVGKTAYGTRGLHEHFLLTMNLYFPDAENHRGQMEKLRNWNLRQAQGKMINFLPTLARRKYDFDALFEALDDGDRPVRMTMSLALFDESEERVEAAVSNARTYYRELGFQLMEDRWFLRPLFLNALPLGMDGDAIQMLGRYKTMGTRHVVRMLPIISDWRGSGTQTMQFVSRGGQLMNLCLYDSDTNYNACVAAQSGAGKSFFTNEVLCSYLSQGDRAWVIDVGRSYEKTADVLGGQFMVFSDEADIQLNPFPLVQDYKDEEDALVGLLTAMASDQEMLSDIQTSGLKRVLGGAWKQHGQDLTVDRLVELLLADDDTRVQDVGKRMFAFTSDGGYGHYFNRGNNIDLSNPFMVLELEELKGRKHLQRVVLLQLIYQIQQEMYLSANPQQKKILIIDEAWDLLAEPSVARFIEGGYRRFRKYNGAAMVITQSINDLYNSPTGVAIAENSANMFLLNQKGSSIDAIKREGRLPLSDAGYDILKTVHTQKGKYSEIFFLTETKGAGIGRLIGSRFIQLMYSTAPDDKAAIRKYQSRGYRFEEAINCVIAEEERQKEAI